jgi:CDP-diacylglycerol---serine O-phosphatidyltransferase
MNIIAKHTPNSLTLMNVLSGCISIVLAFQGHLTEASILIFIGGIFDFFDGFAARLLKSYSELGKMLDSLADMVTFGVAPSIIMFQLIKLAWFHRNPLAALDPDNLLNIIIPSTAFIIALFSALRLAKFNIDTRQTDSFIGVPTPATAFFVASLPFLYTQYAFVAEYAFNIYVLSGITVVLSALMVSEIPMLSFKFKSFGFKENISRYILIFCSVVLFAIFQIAAFPAIFVIYLILSIIEKPQSKIQSE